MWYTGKFMRYSISFILIMLMIFLLDKISFFLNPFKQFIAVLITPILISLALYYMFRPIVHKVRSLKKDKINKSLSIVIVFIAFILVFGFILTYAGSIISYEFKGLSKELPEITQQAKLKLEVYLKTSTFIDKYKVDIKSNYGNIAKILIPSGDSIQSASSWLSSAISAITNITTVLVVVPFILFYFLRDDMFFYIRLLRKIPKSYRRAIAKIIKETDKTLGSYVISQATIALILGGLTYIGYLIIGLKYSFILATFVCITSFIPIFGVILGTIPAIIVGISTDPMMVVYILIIIVVVQQIEGNFISPYIMGKSLKIHPLTVILIFLAAASVYGFIGMLMVVPVYAVLKVALSGIYRVYKLYRVRNLNSAMEDKGTN